MRLRAETSQHPRARMQITPEQGRFLQLLVRLTGATRVLEIGVFTGYSSLSMALALPANGHLIALDINEEFTAVARRYWQEAGVESRIDLRLAPALDSLAALRDAARDEQFDLVFIDADKGNYLAYYEQSMALLRRGGLIAIDNTLWHGDVARPEINDPETLAVRQINDHVCGDARVFSCLLPVGDGLTLAYKL